MVNSPQQQNYLYTDRKYTYKICPHKNTTFQEKPQNNNIDKGVITLFIHKMPPQTANPLISLFTCQQNMIKIIYMYTL